VRAFILLRQSFDARAFCPSGNLSRPRRRQNFGASAGRDCPTTSAVDDSTLTPRVRLIMAADPLQPDAIEGVKATAAVQQSTGGKIPFVMTTEKTHPDLTKQLSKARLVTCGRLVRAARELESEHRCHRRRPRRSYGTRV